jgi:glycerol-3-phosphate dehydrogenase (NAD(P)+)
LRITVLGCGSWGTALTVSLGRKGLPVKLWGRIEDGIDQILDDRVNTRYLPGVPLPETVECQSDVRQALDGAEVVVMAVPSTAVRDVAKQIAGLIGDDVLLVHAGKGLESETGLRGSEVITQVLGEQIGARCVVLSGPNLAVELANEIPTATVVACRDANRAVVAQELFSSDCLRVYRNPDVPGVELGGALKNVLAIGAGISDGLGYGDNTKATVVTRGLIEMTRLGTLLGADPRTFSGLSGFGDLMATCASRLSRNLRLGLMIGEGKTLDQALQVLGQVAEGAYTCRAAYLLSKKHDISMPITEQVHAMLFEGKSPRQAVHDLMTRDHKDEFPPKSPTAVQ